MKFDLILTALGARPCAMSTRKVLALLLMAVVTTWVSGCASSDRLGVNVAVSEFDQPDYAKTKKHNVNKVLLVNTNNGVERYQSAQTAFTQTLHGAELMQVDLAGDANPVDRLQDILNDNRFDAIYCIGAKALGAVDYIEKGIPVVYSSVLNWRRFAGQSNYFGVASEVAPEAQLTWFRYFFPDIKKVGVLYSAENSKLIADASQAAQSLAIELVAEQIDSPEQLTTKLAAMASKVDVFWLISDPVVLSSPEKTQAMFAYAQVKRIPVVTYNRFFVELGAVLSIAADLPTTGRQAALMLQKIISRGAPAGSIQFPAGTTITLNMGKVRELGIKLNEGAFDAVNEIIDAQSQPQD